ncbi:MAG: DUF1559 domain-containing protein [Planctomycetes bacterium]|nr:DUF1559 domain-containing protein [Planctomycetota bacterium]
MRHAHPENPRNGFTLIEVLVALAIVAVLMGLLLVAVQKARQAANRTQCASRLREISMAAHAAHAARGSFPPGIGDFPDGTLAYGTFFYHILPYIDQRPLYEESAYSGKQFVGHHRVYRQPVPLYICPSDPSVSPDRTATDKDGNVWGVASYAVNAQVVFAVDYKGATKSPQNYARLTHDFPDGVSNTLLLTEKYAQCFNGNYPTGGTLWAYFNTKPGNQAFHAGFSVSWNDYSIGPSSKFQVQPTPFNGNCDPTLASSPHTGGIQVAMADASVKFLSSGITNYTWWYLCTPAGGEVIPADTF